MTLSSKRMTTATVGRSMSSYVCIINEVMGKLKVYLAFIMSRVIAKMPDNVLNTQS
jgi:hypothetical protein